MNLRPFGPELLQYPFVSSYMYHFIRLCFIIVYYYIIICARAVSRLPHQIFRAPISAPMFSIMGHPTYYTFSLI